jgi:ribose transport system substrate-binding protein
VKAEGERRGYVVEWTSTNANGDVTKQANDIRDLITKGCEVIFCPALDSKTILSSIAEVHNADRYFVSFFREVHESAVGPQVPSATVNMDSEFQAYGATRETFKMMAEDGVEPRSIIDVHGDIADENAHNREAGFRRALREFGYEDRVAQVVDSGHWEPEVALQNTAAALQAHPDSNMMYVSSDWLMSGVQTALENAGKWHPRGHEDHVYIAGTDMYPSGIQYTIDGYMDGNVDVPCWQISTKCAELGFDLIEGKEVTQEPFLVKGTVINSNNAAEVVESAPHLWGVDYAEEE